MTGIRKLVQLQRQQAAQNPKQQYHQQKFDPGFLKEVHEL